MKKGGGIKGLGGGGIGGLKRTILKPKVGGIGGLTQKKILPVATVNEDENKDTADQEETPATQAATEVVSEPAPKPTLIKTKITTKPKPLPVKQIPPAPVVQ